MPRRRAICLDCMCAATSRRHSRSLAVSSSIVPMGLFRARRLNQSSRLQVVNRTSARQAIRYMRNTLPIMELLTRVNSSSALNR